MKPHILLDIFSAKQLHIESRLVLSVSHFKHHFRSKKSKNRTCSFSCSWPANADGVSRRWYQCFFFFRKIEVKFFNTLDKLNKPLTRFQISAFLYNFLVELSKLKFFNSLFFLVFSHLWESIFILNHVSILIIIHDNLWELFPLPKFWNKFQIQPR